MSTEIYILRHGIAEARDPAKFPDDSLRPLTARGAEKVQEIAGGMKAMGISFDLVLTSSFLRARQTAEIVTRALKIPGRLTLCLSLESPGDPTSLMREIELAGKKASSILLVGHEPFLSSFISLLLCGRERANIALKKGGLCLLTVDFTRQSLRATLEWLLTPRQLRQMAP